jgi:hypothetical protein
MEGASGGIIQRHPPPSPSPSLPCGPPGLAYADPGLSAALHPGPALSESWSELTRGLWRRRGADGPGSGPAAAAAAAAQRDRRRGRAGRARSALDEDPKEGEEAVWPGLEYGGAWHEENGMDD